jgi:hypothetical protein
LNIKVETPISVSNATISEAKTSIKRTCACDDATLETPVCANNGVTYKSSCRFDCAKARVSSKFNGIYILFIFDKIVQRGQKMDGLAFYIYSLLLLL